MKNLKTPGTHARIAAKQRNWGVTVFKIISLTLAIFSAQLSWGQDLAAKSAHREPGVSYKAYKAKAQILSQGREVLGGVSRSAVDSAVKFGSGTLPAATDWESQEDMLKRFQSFRDLRFLKDDQHAGFKRRSTWLYPDDGCFARAALANRNLSNMAVPVPNKVFVFGDLSVRTQNAPGGSVTWWYHVAPLVEVDGQKYVLDPAIEPHHPLKLEEWLATMSTTPQELEVAVCATGSYTPYDSCAHVSDGKELEAEADQAGYLDYEWERLESLRRDPTRELGDNPPWN